MIKNKNFEKKYARARSRVIVKGIFFFFLTRLKNQTFFKVLLILCRSAFANTFSS